MYAKAIYRTIMSMTPFYIENLCVWVKTAVWDAICRLLKQVLHGYGNADENDNTALKTPLLKNS